MVNMSRAQEEAAATCGTAQGGCFNIAGYKINSTIIWIIVIFESKFNKLNEY